MSGQHKLIQEFLLRLWLALSCNPDCPVVRINAVADTSCELTAWLQYQLKWQGGVTAGQASDP